jgi:hypothetical protein
MAGTSTNKSPLLVDRPIFRTVRLDQTSSLTGTVDPGTGSNGALLVSCIGNDGALLEDIQLIQRVANDTTAVNLYISNSEIALGVTTTGGRADAHFIGQFALPAAQAVGAKISFRAPFILAPVPHGPATYAYADVPTWLGQRAPLFQGQRIEKGWALWAAVAGNTPVANAPNISVQGGFH